MFHEPFVLFGYVAGITRRLEMVTGILILPQRQTVLVAKQAAAVDVLSGGRLRLGIGIGWNAVEYEALGEEFHNRGRRSEEQVAVLRTLWTSELVTYQGRWHTITDAGLNPMPVQRPIPIWLGGGGQRAEDAGRGERVLRRIARLGDGWFPQGRPDDVMAARVEKLRGYIREAGRDPQAVGIDPQVSLRGASDAALAGAVRAWRALGATHVSVNTMNAGLASPGGHIEAIARAFEVARGA
jgi:probable F420-dependent oxidoreductase